MVTDERLVSITHPDKRAFLENYPKFKMISKTAEAIGVSRRVVYNWLDSDEDFSHTMHAIKKELDQDLLELHEKDLKDIAFDTTTPKNVRVLAHFFILKALDPDKYREKPLIDKAIIGDITIKLAIPPYNEGMRLEESKIVPIEGEFKEIANGRDGRANQTG